TQRACTTCLTVALALFAGAVIQAAEPAAAAAEIDSVAKLWQDFDPRALPLEVEVFKEWDEADVHLQSLYFTGEEFEGERTRVFGYLGRPKSIAAPEKLPAVLHIH